MPRLTDSARSALAAILERGQGSDDLTLRLVPGETHGMELVPSTASPGDERFQHEGRTVLVLDPTTADQLGDTLIDAEQDGEHGIIFRLVRNGAADD